MERMRYTEARKLMAPGDVIAFGGKGQFSEIIKMATLSPVSHVGCVLQTHIGGDDRYFNQVIESTSIGDFNGVSISRLSDRINAYDGEVWWLPLSHDVLQKFDRRAFFNFLLAQEGKDYDTHQAVFSALDILDSIGIGRNKEDFAKFFCSELVSAALEKGGAIGPINASEVTPIDLVRFKIYDRIVKLRGLTKDISRFNTVEV